MKKKVWIAFSIIGVLIILGGVGISIRANKPNLHDYSKWLEDNYHVQCLDYTTGCEAFTLKVKEDGQEKTLTMHNMNGGYDPGIFTMTREVHYRSFDNSSYALDIDVKGNNGTFKATSSYALDIDVKGNNGTFKATKVKSTLPN